MRPYYTFPLQTEQLTQKKRHRLAELKEGIADYIHIILKTHLTEYRYDYDFGCYVWNQDFENIKSISKWENALETQIKEAIACYEKRMDAIQTKVKVEDPKDYAVGSNPQNRLKKRIHITVSGTIQKTRELFQHQEFIYFSPLSIH
ncbi:phage baseplate assembly protein W [Catalinimonas alkaloidigena]|uniref:GPW/gp25 family protein n=1 Tax=Catalinimonas alkaloidigena TaxID=1075417 RepID=UPI00240549D8|nr:GPW/gp25 family protein [Catalinimonas alkaloidigena]MDF9798784.1 phage baseplate assembly protein W [Catalinimonas alkaloidigena]